MAMPTCHFRAPADSLIRRAYPFYDLYLDHHSLHNEETVLYARAR